VFLVFLWSATDDLFGAEDVSNDIPTSHVYEDGSELPDESEDPVERLYQDKIAPGISEDDHSESTESTEMSSLSTPLSGSESEWSSSVVVSEKEYLATGLGPSRR
jgi:hypothetical protein